MAPKANLYVSVTRAQRAEGEGYRRALHTWMLSVEPHPFHVPGTHHKDIEPIHYTASKKDEGYTITTHPSTSEPAIIGNILIAEDAHTTPAYIHKILLQENTHSDCAGDAEHWIQSALLAMQKHKVIESFDVDTFMTFARSYEASRMDGEGSSLIAYPKLHKEPEKKTSKHKFWVSHPMSERTKVNGKGEASVYGGLM